ncbi:MAG: hypothetical protein ABIH39_09050, partial [Candidatus Margulisiibacteriota bacterium]
PGGYLISDELTLKDISFLADYLHSFTEVYLFKDELQKSFPDFKVVLTEMLAAPVPTTPGAADTGTGKALPSRPPQILPFIKDLLKKKNVLTDPKPAFSKEEKAMLENYARTKLPDGKYKDVLLALVASTHAEDEGLSAKEAKAIKDWVKSKEKEKGFILNSLQVKDITDPVVKRVLLRIQGQIRDYPQYRGDTKLMSAATNPDTINIGASFLYTLKQSINPQQPAEGKLVVDDRKLITLKQLYYRDRLLNVKKAHKEYSIFIKGASEALQKAFQTSFDEGLKLLVQNTIYSLTNKLNTKKQE